MVNKIINVMCVFNDIYIFIFIILSFYDYDNIGNWFEIFSLIYFIIDYLIFGCIIIENYIINNIISNKELFFE